MKFSKESLLLYAVTDRSWLKKSTLVEQVEKSIQGGVTCVQLREKKINKKEFIKEAKAIKCLCQKHQIPLIINDNVDVAIACMADGIHVGQSDMDAKNVRKLIGNKMILGVSVQNVNQAILAEQNGADYLGVGTVFSTTTKLDADYVSYNTLKEICSVVKIPVVAIGGINSHNIELLKGSNIAGVALVSAIFAAKNIKEECEKLLMLVNEVIDSNEKIEGEKHEKCINNSWI